MLQGKRRSGTKVQKKDTKFELCGSIEILLKYGNQRIISSETISRDRFAPAFRASSIC